MSWDIYLSSPHMGNDEMDFVKEAFETNWIAPLGPHVDAFEEAVANYVGDRHVAALSSGTAALHLALVMLGVGRDDEVLCQSFTFCGSANPIVYQGAVPIFVDSENETWNMDPDLLEHAIKDRIARGKKPKAIIYVHLYGMPAKVDEIRAVAGKYEIPLIEDAAEALGSRYFGKMCGSLGDMSAISFNGNKIITTSSGGALLSDDPTLIQRAKFLATQARDEAAHYEHSSIGFNYRMSNVCAGIGRGQMNVLEERVRLRRRNFDFYRREMGNIAEIKFLEEPEGFFCNRWLTTILVDPINVTREDIRLMLIVNKIEARPLWKPLHLQPVYKDCISYTNGVSETLFKLGLCLPSGSNLTEDNLYDISRTVQSMFV
jgi:dTDP-4-amino-4,6-dideoxygalactose transaminase